MSWKKITQVTIQNLNPAWWRSSGPADLNCSKCGNMCSICSETQKEATRMTDPTRTLQPLELFDTEEKLKRFHSLGHPAPKPPTTKDEKHRLVPRLWKMWMKVLDTVQDTPNDCKSCQFQIVKPDSSTPPSPS